MAVALMMVLPSLAAAGSIGGKVQLEGTTEPVAGMVVVLYKWDSDGVYWQWQSSVETKATGQFQFGNLAAGTYSLYFSNSWDEYEKYIEEFYKDVPQWAESKRTNLELAEGQDLKVGSAKIKLRPFYVKEVVLEPGAIVPPSGGELTLKATIINTTGKAASLYFWGISGVFSLNKNDYYGLYSVFPIVDKFKAQLNPGENVLDVPVTIKPGFSNGWTEIMLFGGTSYLQPALPPIFAPFCKGTVEACASEERPRNRRELFMPGNN